MNALEAYEQSSWTYADTALVIIAAIAIPLVFAWTWRQLKAN